MTATSAERGCVGMTAEDSVEKDIKTQGGNTRVTAAHVWILSK
jgi:hypothetical protein